MIILKKYIEFLKLNKLRPGTIRTYTTRLNWYLANIETDELVTRDKNYIDQVKQAYKYFLRMNDSYYDDNLKKLTMLHKTAKKRKLKPVDTLHLKNVNQKINLLKNKRKKLAFRLMEISGLRIEEISNLGKDDLKFIDNHRIIVHVRDGKGGKPRKIITFNDKYVWDNLKLMDNRNGKLFYSKETLMKLAKELGFRTHRLRKVFSETLLLKGGNKETVQKALGHGDTRTLKRYTQGTKINVYGTKFDI
jgi:integrase/recombinase XerD